MSGSVRIPADPQVEAVFSVAQESQILRTQVIANEGDPQAIAGKVLAASISNQN